MMYLYSGILDSKEKKRVRVICSNEDKFYKNNID